MIARLPPCLPRAAWLSNYVCHSILTHSRAPPARLSLCSQTLSELARRFVLADKEASDRERRHESVSARPDSDVVGVVVRRMVREAGAQPLGWDRGLI